MEKLKLDLEDLAVESFATTPEPRAEGGTVFGQQCTCYTQCTCPGCPTCDASCNGTCGGTCEASCNGTCGPTCDVSCYGTCGVGTCGPTWDASCDTCDCTNEWGRC
ncbi:MAG TPA: hypothetical protein VK399_12765 [Longimicrobiaceae bacterium]|nr:hypothetical protein [Longimicrobiaceae bacterium]